MKVIHAGDLHVWRHGIPLSDPFAVKRWLGAGNLLLRRAAVFPERFRESALKAIQHEAPDLMVFSGDFTQASQSSEFRECARLFEPLHTQLGDRLVAIPGNHDVYTRASERKELIQKELPWVRTDPVTRLDLEGTLTIVTVNHSEPFRIRSNGRVKPLTQENLRTVLTTCRDEKRVVILVGHYPYATPPEHPEAPHHQLLGEEMFAEVVREFAPPLYLHGHKHVRWAIRPAVTPNTLCLNCGSLGMRSEDPQKQAGFLSWDQQDDGTFKNLTAHSLRETGEWRKQPVSLSG